MTTKIQRGNEIELTIDRVSYGGDSLGHAPDGRVVFVRGAAPGDVVDVELTQVRKRFMRGQITHRKSTAGIDAFCPHVGTCGGCPWQTVERTVQRDTLHAHLARALSQATGQTIEVEPSPETEGKAWRGTARLHWRDGVVGYRAAGSREIIPVDKCPVLAPPLDALYAAVRTHLGPAFSEGQGTLRLSARPGSPSGTVSLHPRARKRRKLRLNAVRALYTDPACHGGIVVWPDGTRDAVGDAFNTFAGVKHPAESFVQAHQSGAQTLIEDVVATLTDRGPVWELYAGSGPFTLALAKAGMSVTAVELDARAAAALQGASEGLLVNVINEDAAAVTAGKPGAVLIDPPRAGAADVLPAIHASTATRLAYVSCELGALSRDVRWLTENGWTVQRARIYDLFPHTGHAEALVVLDRPAT